MFLHKFLKLDHPIQSRIGIPINENTDIFFSPIKQAHIYKIDI